MKTQGVITVPVQNGKVQKTSQPKSGSSYDMDFMSVMNDLTSFSKDNGANAPDKASKQDSGRDDIQPAKSTFSRKDVTFKASYRSDSDSHLVKKTALDNSSRSTETDRSTPKTGTKSDNADKTSRADRKETPQKTGSQDDPESIKGKRNITNRDTGVSGPETEDSTVDEDGAMEDFTSDVLDTIKKDLDTDDATIMSALQSLGLSISDLIIPGNAAQLYMTITGSTPSDLLTSDSFIGFMGDMNDLFSQVPDEILSQMTPVTDDDSDILSSLGDQLNGSDADTPVVTDETVTVAETTDGDSSQIDVTVLNVTTDDMSDNVSVPTAASDDSTADNAAQTVLASDTVTASDKQPSGTESVQNPATAAETVAQTAQNTTSDSSDTGKQNGLSGRNEGSQQSTPEINTNVTQTTVTMNATEGTFAETITRVSKYTDINTDNLISQIVEKAKQSLSSTVRSLEMELNPHSLGKIFLQVAEKSGDVSAHLYAQNEAVRHALENRMADLCDNLAKQGIRVNEVTISVEPHAFERNLEENAGNMAGGAQQQSSENDNAAGYRREHGASIDIRNNTDAPMTAADELEAEIMRDNGNTVSYFA